MFLFRIMFQANVFITAPHTMKLGDLGEFTYSAYLAAAGHL